MKLFLDINRLVCKHDSSCMRNQLENINEVSCLQGYNQESDKREGWQEGGACESQERICMSACVKESVEDTERKQDGANHGTAKRISSASSECSLETRRTEMLDQDKIEVLQELIRDLNVTHNKQTEGRESATFTTGGVIADAAKLILEIVKNSGSLTTTGQCERDKKGAE